MVSGRVREEDLGWFYCQDDSPRWCGKAVSPRVPKRNLSPSVGHHPRRYSPACHHRGVHVSPVPRYAEPVLAGRGPSGREGPKRRDHQPRSPVVAQRGPDDSPRGHPGPRPHQRGVGPLSPSKREVDKRRRVGTSMSPRQAVPGRGSPVVHGNRPNMVGRGGEYQGPSHYPFVVQGVLVSPRPNPSGPPGDCSPLQKGPCGAPPPAWGPPVGRRGPQGVSRSVEMENRGPNVHPVPHRASPANAGGILASPLRLGGLARRKLECPTSSRAEDDSPRSCYEAPVSVLSEGGRSPQQPRRRRW